MNTTVKANKGTKKRVVKAQTPVEQTTQAPELINESVLKDAMKGTGSEVKELSKKDYDMLHLAPNVTGKMLMDMKFGANKSAKEEIRKEIYSFSSALKRAIKHLELEGYFKGVKHLQNKTIEEISHDFTPANLKPFQTQKQLERKDTEFWSIYLVISLIEKFVKAEARQGFAIKAKK